MGLCSSFGFRSLKEWRVVGMSKRMVWCRACQHSYVFVSVCTSGFVSTCIALRASYGIRAGRVVLQPVGVSAWAEARNMTGCEVLPVCICLHLLAWRTSLAAGHGTQRFMWPMVKCSGCAVMLIRISNIWHIAYARMQPLQSKLRSTFNQRCKGARAGLQT